MIAAFLATRLGRWCAIAGGAVLAVLTFGAWQRRAGAQAARQQQQEQDHAAVVRADRAEAEYRGGGGAQQRMRDGTF